MQSKSNIRWRLSNGQRRYRIMRKNSLLGLGSQLQWLQPGRITTFTNINTTARQIMRAPWRAGSLTHAALRNSLHLAAALALRHKGRAAANNRRSAFLSRGAQSTLRIEMPSRVNTCPAEPPTSMSSRRSHQHHLDEPWQLCLENVPCAWPVLCRTLACNATCLTSLGPPYPHCASLSNVIGYAATQADCCTSDTSVASVSGEQGQPRGVEAAPPRQHDCALCFQNYCGQLTIHKLISCGAQLML